MSHDYYLYYNVVVFAATRSRYALKKTETNANEIVH